MESQDRMEREEQACGSDTSVRGVESQERIESGGELKCLVVKADHGWSLKREWKDNSLKR